MKRLILPVALSLSAAAQAADQAFLTPFPYFVANCLNCHADYSKIKSSIPNIAGRDKDYLETALKAFKAGKKEATIMHQLAKGYTDEEIAVLADYFSRQK